jgi:hypothetical protein
MADKQNNKQLEPLKMNGAIINRPLPYAPLSTPALWMYRTLFAVCLAACVALLGFVGMEFVKQGNRQPISGADQYAHRSDFNAACKQILDRTRNDALPLGQARLQLASLEVSESRDLFFSGLLTFHRIRNLGEDQQMKYRDFRRSQPGFENLLGHISANDLNDESMLYVAYLLRDVMIYIYNHPEKIDTGIDAGVWRGPVEENVEQYFSDVLVVYDFLKGFVSLHESSDQFYRDAGNLDLLSIGLYSKASYATRWLNKKEEIDSIIRTIDNNDFKIGGEKLTWYHGLKSELRELRDSHITGFAVRHRCPRADGRWLL